jgi:hypothetical protein
MPLAEAGADIVYDVKTRKTWMYYYFGPGLSPVALFRKFRNGGINAAAGVIWNYNSPTDWSGFGVGAAIPIETLHLLPAATFRSTKMWGQ